VLVRDELTWFRPNVMEIVFIWIVSPMMRSDYQKPNQKDPKYVSDYNEEVITMIMAKYEFKYKDASKDFWHLEIIRSYLIQKWQCGNFRLLRFLT